MAEDNVYRSSSSVNSNSESQQGGSYSAQRNGHRAYNGKPSSTNSGSNQHHLNAKQANGLKNNPDSEEDDLPLNIKQRLKKEVAKKALVAAASTFATPKAGKAVEKALETEKGDEYLETFAKEKNSKKGLEKVLKKLQDETGKKSTILTLVGVTFPILLFLMIFSALFLKTADSQIYSNENNGEIDEFAQDLESEGAEGSVFKEYPGLYEKIEKIVEEQRNETHVAIDKYLIIATLIAPIDNGLISPVSNEEIPKGAKNECNQDLCYKFQKGAKNDSITYLNYDKFLELWGDHAKYLARMQILTYADIHSTDSETQKVCSGKAKKGEDTDTMWHYAQNDKNVGANSIWHFLDWLNWFNTYTDEIKAEINAKCIDAEPGTSKVPDVKVLSIEQGVYYPILLGEKNGKPEYDYTIDKNTGGVYYWNLLNKDGFIDTYMQAYLAYDSDDADENYNNNLATIVDTANHIYTYYETIRKDCHGYEELASKTETVDFQEDASSEIYTLDIEEAFVGGSVLATYGGATGEVAKAQAILSRSEAYNYVAEQGGDVIVGTAKMGCWWHEYNPTYDPKYKDQADNPNYDPEYPKREHPEIYEAVTSTKGIVVTGWNNFIVEETQFDAFCPTTREPVDGFYYLPDGQNNLPIDLSRFSPPSGRADCPCFQNRGVRPKVEFETSLAVLTNKFISSPAQQTLEKCWTPTGETKTDEDGNTLYGFEYETTGGHGEGVSQHGMAYYSQFGYKWDGLIGLFYTDKSNNLPEITYKVLSGSCKENQECVNSTVFDSAGNKINVSS